MSVHILRRAGITAAGLLLLGSGTANATELSALASGSTPTSIISAAYPGGCKVQPGDLERQCCYPSLHTPWDVSAKSHRRPYIEIPNCWPRVEVLKPDGGN